MSPMLNYTTSIDAHKTIGEIQQILARAGALGIAVEYHQQHPAGLSFSLTTPIGVQTFSLPVDVQAMFVLLTKQRVIPNDQVKRLAQAERTAWRVIKNWIEAQLAIIETKMVTIDQVMLPFMHTGNGRTVHEQFVAESKRELTS